MLAQDRLQPVVGPILTTKTDGLLRWENLNFVGSMTYLARSWYVTELNYAQTGYAILLLSLNICSYPSAPIYNQKVKYGEMNKLIFSVICEKLQNLELLQSRNNPQGTELKLATNSPQSDTPKRHPKQLPVLAWRGGRLLVMIVSFKKQQSTQGFYCLLFSSTLCSTYVWHFKGWVFISYLRRSIYHRP